MAVGVNIYPPVLDTYMPAFLKGGETVPISGGKSIEGYKIYLSLSDYNVFDDVCKNVQVTLVRQDTNKTALLASAASSGIRVTQLYSERDEEGNIKYYIVIDKNALVSKSLLTSIFYKVQIRFTSSRDQDGQSIPQVLNPVDSSWYTKYLDCFSEWSTVCLIKGIETPSIKLTGLTAGAITTISKPSLDIVGSFNYNTGKIEKETLRSYQVLLYKKGNDIAPIEDSGEILTNQNNSPNKINYSFTSFLASAASGVTDNYYVKLIYTTINMYSNKNNPLIYKIKVTYNSSSKVFDILTISNNENGIIQLQITKKDKSNFTSPIVVKRACSLDNFSSWETIHTFNNINVAKHIFNDMTVESGVLYKYYTYYYDLNNKTYASPSETTDPIMIVLDFILLTTKNKQLKLYFDGRISNANYTVIESKTDTIGGQYPVIRKNGNLMYRTLPLEGTIHSYMDDIGFFETKKTLYGNNKLFYEKYNSDNKIIDTQDHVYEKFFRDKVKEFLFKDQYILLRTPSEGNLIVKCINNNFSPNTQLNNLIYKFSTNAVEIDKCNLTNIKKYFLIKETGEDISITKNNIGNNSVLSGIATSFEDSLNRKEEINYEI